MTTTAEDSPLLKLWQELRKRLLLWLTCLLIFALVLLPYAPTLFNIFARPLVSVLDNTRPLIAIGILSGFWVPIELSLWFALLLSIPILLNQIWLFIKPALKNSEKFISRFYLLSSLLLFLGGIIFAYTLVLPICLHVLFKATPSFVQVMPDIVNYLNFSFRLLLTFALACQTPLIILLLCHLQLTTIKQLAAVRRYIIIAAFVLAMILAPDVISQCFLAIPLWLLFELGLLLSKLFERRKNSLQ